MNTTSPQSPSDGWKFVASTSRFFYHKEDGKRLIVGDDGQEPPRYWFVAYRAGKEIAVGEGYGSAQEAQVATEAV